MRFVTSLLFLLLFFPVRVSALEIPTRPEGYISDFANLLSPQAKARLEENLRHFEQDSSNQIAVVTFPSLEGEVLEDFSIRLAEKWKIGQKAKDNGVILLIFKEDRAVRIEVGYGLEGALTDQASKLIIQNEIIPRFREGQFDEGIETAVQAIIQATKGEYQPDVKSGSKLGGWKALAENGWLVLILILFAPLVIWWILFGVCNVVALWALLIGDPHLALIGFGLSWVSVIIYFLLRWFLPGRLILSRDGALSTRSRWGGSGLGGGFGGGGFSGGGGSFGGGGASGRW